MADKPENAAGYWGSAANCDIPERTFDKAIDFIKKDLSDDIDFIIWTGDNTGHNLWEQSAKSNVKNTKL